MLEDYIGLVLGERYEIQAPLGSGGMALVFRAHDRALDRQVAIKIVKPGLFPSAEIPEAADRFIREARIIANLEHAHILKVYDQGKQLIEGQTLVYLVMQLASAGTLADRLKAGVLKPHEADTILRQVCDALDYAHDREVLHLDLKPLNILFDNHGNALVADFGLAKLLQGASRVKADTGFGTPIYMPPEQSFGREAGPFSDVYALGVTLYELLTGELPEPDWSDPLFRLRLDHPLPPRIRSVIEKATQPAPGQRYRTAGELAQAFTTAVAPPAPVPAEWGTELDEGEPAEAQTPATDRADKRRGPPGMLAEGRLQIAIAVAGLIVGSIACIATAIVVPEVRQMVGLAPSVTPAVPTATRQTATPAPTPAPTPSPTATPTPTPSPVPYLAVSVERLCIYAGPGEAYDMWGEVHRGDRLPLCGRSADGAWWQVDYLGRKGWIRAQAVGPNVEPTVLPPVKPPPTPRRTAMPTREPTPTPLGPNTVLRLQNPGFEGILQENAIPGWQWWAEDNYGAGEEYDPGTSFDTPVFTQAEDPARMINGPTLQIEATAFVNLRVRVFQTVNAPPSATVRFRASAKAFSNAGGIRLAAGIDPDGGPDCSQARWGDALTIDQSWGAVQLFAPDVAVGPAGRATVCLRAENVNPGRSNAAYFDNAALIANPQ